ncbi:hypothetical protein, partial [Streptomyces sp. NPDC058664]
MTQPTDRPGIDQLTSDQLDQLYAERDWWHQAYLASRDYEDRRTAERDQFQRERNEQHARADKAEAALTAVRKLHAPVNHRGRTICGHCSGYGGGSCDNGPQGHPCPT